MYGQATAWMAEHPKEGRPPWESYITPKYQNMQWMQNVQQQNIDNKKATIEAHNLQSQLAVQASKAFWSDVSKLDPTDESRSMISQTPANPDGTPSPQQLQILKEAQVAAAAKAKAAQDAALAQGGTLKTINGPRGSTTIVVPETNKAGKQDPVIALQNQQQTYSNLLEQSDNPDDQKWYQDKIDELGQRINRLSNFAGTKESIKSEVIQLNKAGIPTNRVTTVTSPGKVSTAPQVITDKSGKKWTYTGTMSDPTKDKDPSHWKQQ
jgi:hypothetical protein